MESNQSVLALILLWGNSYQYANLWDMKCESTLHM